MMTTTSFSESQGTLARLLAKENIKIQHGNYQTAFFDVKNRVLGLPNWKDLTKDVYDLLCGHEVGHALYTPHFGWETAVAAGLNRSYLNIVEDARIERKIQETYPGLISCFRRAYQVMHVERNFFGVKTEDAHQLGFADRLNLHFKLGSLIGLTFSAEESKIVELVQRAETWDDVVAATRELQKFVSEQQKKAEDKSDESTSDEVSDETSEVEMPSAPDSSDESSPESELEAPADSSDETPKQDSDISAEAPSTDSQPKGESTKSESDNSTKKDGRADSTSANGSEAGSSDDLPDVTTDSSFTEKSKELIDTSDAAVWTNWFLAPTDAEIAEAIVPYADLAKARLGVNLPIECNRDSFIEFLNKTNKIVNGFVKEFELRKAAYQYSRATTSKTGSLDTNRLHAYRTSDDIFLSVTRLANSKNHAMVMVVDYSGSMQRILPDVLKQIINVSLFCRRVGIPFRVFAFTDGYRVRPYESRTHTAAALENATVDRISLGATSMLELISSDLSKSDFETALMHLYMRAEHEVYAYNVEGLGGTPLNEAAICLHKIVNDMKARFNPDHMIAMVLTDGNGHALRTCHAANLNHLRTEISPTRWHHVPEVAFTLNGRRVKAKDRGMTPALIRNLSMTTGCTTICMDLQAKSRQRYLEFSNLSRLVSELNRNKPVPSEVIAKKKFEEYVQNDIVALDGAAGYSKYFFIHASSAMAFDDEDELEVDADMSRSRIINAFKKFSSAKKNNRILTVKLAEALA